MDIQHFNDLLAAARQQPEPQRLLLVFAAALPGQGRQAPAPAQVDAALQRMVEAVKSGQLAGMIPFDRQGEAVQLG